jgi:hypothetical protein
MTMTEHQIHGEPQPHSQDSTTGEHASGYLLAEDAEIVVGQMGLLEYELLGDAGDVLACTVQRIDWHKQRVTEQADNGARAAVGGS